MLASVGHKLSVTSVKGNGKIKQNTCIYLSIYKIYIVLDDEAPNQEVLPTQAQAKYQLSYDQESNKKIKRIYGNNHLPIWRVFLFLLNDVFGQRISTIVLRSRPLDLYFVLVDIHNFRSSRLTGSICEFATNTNEVNRIKELYRLNTP